MRYEHEPPSELLHTDTQKTRTCSALQPPVTDNWSESVDGADWKTLLVAIDRHARLAFISMYLDEKTAQAVLLVRNAVVSYVHLCITVKRLLTDNGPALRSRGFRASCIELIIKQSFTRPYRPQTNGRQSG